MTATKTQIEGDLLNYQQHYEKKYWKIFFMDYFCAEIKSYKYRTQKQNKTQRKWNDNKKRTPIFYKTQKFS